MVGIKEANEQELIYTTVEYKEQRIISTYSSKRARKNAIEREKLLEKASQWLSDPNQYRKVIKRVAGRYIRSDDRGFPTQLDEERISKMPGMMVLKPLPFRRICQQRIFYIIQGFALSRKRFSGFK